MQTLTGRHKTAWPRGGANPIGGAVGTAVTPPAGAVRISLIYFNAGGGHRAAAIALHEELLRQHPDWSVSLVDLFAVLDPNQLFKRFTGFAPEAYYNKRLSTGFTLGLAQELKLLQAMIRLSDHQLVKRLAAYWSMTEPTLVVSLVPNFNRAIGQSVKLALPQAPFVTMMTDLADYPPNFWVEPGYTSHLICPTRHALTQGIAAGLEPQKVHAVSGTLLSPRFYEAPPHDREAARCALGFKPDEEIGLVMFGGHGSAAMKRIAVDLAHRPLILMCGRNEALGSSLMKLPKSAHHHVVGFTDNVAHYMRLADYFIGKPGPGSISEALHCGLPVIVARNAWTMPQERWNTDWVQACNLGRVVPSFAKIENAVKDVLANLENLRGNVNRVQNRALYEVPALLGKLVCQGSMAIAS